MRELCLNCLRPQKACFCSKVDSFETQTKFIILMHPKESKKSFLGTGRLSHTALKNSQIIVGVNFDEDPQVQAILNNNSNECILLYPGESSINLSRETLPVTPKQRIIFILDGTWPCAKKMMRKSTSLHDLPRVSFETKKTSEFIIKHQPANYCLSTIESIYVLLSELEEQKLEDTKGKKQTLLQALENLVQFQIKCANDPSLQNFKRFKERADVLPRERVASKKWEKRKVCFQD